MILNSCQSGKNGGNQKTRHKACSSSLLFDNRIDVKFLTTKEASLILGVSENALRILVHRKKIKTYKLGSRLRFLLSDLISSLQSKED